MDNIVLCSIEGCGKPKSYTSKLYCPMHYQRKRKGMDMRPEPLILLRKDTFDFFENIKPGSADCIIWPYWRNSSGYAEFAHRNYKSKIVSRNVCIKFHGKPRNESDEAAHSCGNGHLGCVNPDHLSWKSHKGNHEDRESHGTNLAGVENPNAKLTDEKVLQMRKMRGEGFTYQAIADAFDVAIATSHKICIRKGWKHI